VATSGRNSWRIKAIEAWYVAWLWLSLAALQRASACGSGARQPAQTYGLAAALGAAGAWRLAQRIESGAGGCGSLLVIKYFFAAPTCLAFMLWLLAGSNVAAVHAARSGCATAK